jgi:hypothetical protein
MMSSQSYFLVCIFIPCPTFFFYTNHDGIVGEDEEVSIKEVADAIVKAFDFKGEYTVSLFDPLCPVPLLTRHLLSTLIASLPP